MLLEEGGCGREAGGLVEMKKSIRNGATDGRI
jgi:hypothetical protein